MTVIDTPHQLARDVMPAASCGGPVESRLAALRELQARHPLWGCRLLAGFARGAFSRGDLRYIFSQYPLYTSSFTRAEPDQYSG
ncbi:MAG TPA: hypothetical protein VHW23_26330 [Kofleriaceae bacterium]|nr:hypothetical protein [Kofleriaceae bacterium]